MKNFWRRLLPGGERLRMPPRAVTLWFWAIWALITLPQMIMDSAFTYDTAISSGHGFWPAAGEALASFVFVGIFLFGLMGAMLFFVVSLFTSVVIPDTVSAYQSTRDAVRRVPAAWQRTRENVARAFSRARQVFVAIVRFLGGIPVKIAAMTARDWLFAFYAVLSFALLAGMLWFAWGWAGSVVAWLPEWVSSGHKDWFLQIVVDWFICMLPWTIGVSVLNSVFKAIVRRRSGR